MPYTKNPATETNQNTEITLLTSLNSHISNISMTRATYSCSIATLAPASSATDIFTITGDPAFTPVRITQIGISAEQTTASLLNLSIIKRSTANSGGTSTTPTIVNHDSSSVSPKAVVRAYTANPTLGTSAGTARTFKFLTSGLLALSDDAKVFSWDLRSTPITLRSNAEVLAVNLGGVTVSGGSFNIFVEWTEGVLV